MNAENTLPETAEDKLVRNAALRGIIEIMISPEVGSGWLHELMEHMTENTDAVITDAMSEKADELMTKRFNAMARELALELDEEFRGTFYSHFSETDA